MSKSIILALCIVTLSGCAQKIVWDSPDPRTWNKNVYYKDTYAYQKMQEVDANMDPKTKAKWDKIAKSKSDEIEVIIIGVIPLK